MNAWTDDRLEDERGCFDRLDERLGRVEIRLDRIDERIQDRFDRSDERIQDRFDRSDERFEKLVDKIDRRFDTLILAMITLTVAIIFGFAGLILA